MYGLLVSALYNVYVFLMLADEDVTGGEIDVNLHWAIFPYSKQIDLCDVLDPCLLKAGNGSYSANEEVPSGIPGVSVIVIVSVS